MLPPNHFWVVGHRGSPAREPENTIASFARALADGANGLELDLCVTSDGQVVLWHDPSPFDWRARLRRVGLEPVVRYRPRVPSDRRYRRPVSELTLTEFRAHFGYAVGFGRVAREPIPTLDDFMAWAREQRGLGLVFLDVKVPAEREDLLRVLLRKVDELVSHHAPAFRIVLEVPTPAVASALSRLSPRHGCMLDVEPHAGLVLDFERHSAARAAIELELGLAAPQRPRGITLFPFRTHRRIVEGDLARMKRHNQSSPRVPLEGICAFTINREVEMRTLISLGVSAIQSDRPELLRAAALDCGRSVDIDAIVA